MFTIMENRKRPRLELINTNNNNSTNDLVQGVASAVQTTTNAAMGTATLATIGGQSFILSNSSAAGLPANILLSICDDNSDESEEYILDHTGIVSTPIKQEHSVATQTINQQNQTTNSMLHTTVPQYRIINQPTKTLKNSSLVTNTTANNSASLLTNSVHLPPGCEIYVIKEVLDSPKQILANDSSPSITTSKTSINCNNTIKLEPMSPLPLIRHNTTNLNSHTSLTLNTSNCITNTTSTTTTINNTSSSSSCATSPDDTAKRSLILEAYKKRDDKRRATHNEVERRRRDKINSWIFKLKEMLPSEISPTTGALQKDLNQNSLLNSTRLLVQPGVQGSTAATATTTRTPPSDSKSQILIKACEYIKSMQEEIKSLRECLTENENLRLSNQRLQEEINNLRNKQPKLHNNNNILITTTNNNSHNQLTNNNNHHHQSHSVNDDDDDDDDNPDECEITLNSLNATYANVQLFSPIPTATTNQNQTNHQHHHHHHPLAGLVGLNNTNSNITTTGTVTPTVNVTYAKRELIITDYVD